MALESATYISGLSTSNPQSGDLTSVGDDHIRLVKTTLKNSLPNADKAFYFPTAISKTADYTVLVTDENSIVNVDATSADVEIELPLGADIEAGYQITVVKDDSSSNVVNVVKNSSGSDTINDVNSLTLSAKNDVATLEWNGSRWILSTFIVPSVPSAKTADYTVVAADNRRTIPINAGSGAKTVDLPSSPGDGFEVTIVKIDTGTNYVDIDGNSSDTINGLTNFYLQYPYEKVTLIYINGSWYADWSYTDKGIGKSEVWRFGSAPVWGLVNNGQSVTKTAYPRLNAVFSAASYPYGSTGSTFKLPDDRGRVWRVWADGSSNDPDKNSRTDRGDGTSGNVVGTYQADQYKSHTHSYNSSNDITTSGGSGGIRYSSDVSEPLTSGSSGGNETRMKNVNILSITRF